MREHLNYSSTTTPLFDSTWEKRFYEFCFPISVISKKLSVALQKAYKCSGPTGKKSSALVPTGNKDMHQILDPCKILFLL
jgi:hypothetical protein